jgi:hypothetical protein
VGSILKTYRTFHMRIQTPPSLTIAIQMLRRSHHRIEGLERVHVTGSSQHFMGICNRGYVTSSAFKTHRQSYRRVERLEWVQFSRPFQHSMGICNRGQVAPTPLSKAGRCGNRKVRGLQLSTLPIFFGRLPSLDRQTNICSCHSHPM